MDASKRALGFAPASTPFLSTFSPSQEEKPGKATGTPWKDIILLLQQPFPTLSLYNGCFSPPAISLVFEFEPIPPKTPSIFSIRPSRSHLRTFHSTVGGNQTSLPTPLFQNSYLLLLLLLHVARRTKGRRDSSHLSGPTSAAPGPFFFKLKLRKIGRTFRATPAMRRLIEIDQGTPLIRLLQKKTLILLNEP